MATNQSKTLFIRADATTDIGTGHVMRCLALAQACQDQGGEVTFISHCESEALRQRLIDERMNFVNINKPHPDPSDLKQTLKELSAMSYQPSANCWIVIDGYHFDAVYQKTIKDTGYKILWIDDYGHAAHYYADLVLNQNISAEETLYTHREPYTRLLLGTRYALLRREFKKWQDWQREIPDTAQKVLVTMGGGDPDNVTMKVIQALKQINISGLKAKIVIGPANPNMQILEREISDHANLELITNVTNMPELMAWADIAVAAGGSTCWELALMGLPNILIVFANNQVAVAAGLHKHGLSINMGWHTDINMIDIAKTLNDVMINVASRKKMYSAGKSNVDGQGSARIIAAMHCEEFFLRKASMEDCELLFQWVNDPDARRSAFRSDPIEFIEHTRWYGEKLNDANFIQYIAINQDDEAVGQVRFDLKNDEAEVDVSIAPKFRGRGYGACIIKEGVDNVLKSTKITTFHANIKSNNQASIKSFQKANFAIQGLLVINGHKAVHLILPQGRN